MKTFALGIALGASLFSTAALAEQRPTYLAFSAPAATSVTSASLVAPAAPKVGKRDKGFLAIPLVLPIIGVVAAVAVIVGVTTGGDSSPG